MPRFQQPIFSQTFASWLRCLFCTSMRWPRRCVALTLLVSGFAVQAAPFIYLADRVSYNFSVIDLATYLTIATTPLAAGSAPVNVVANKVTKKVYVGKANSIVIFDAVTNAMVGEIPLASGPLLTGYSTESQSLVIANSGAKAYALTAGLVSVIDLSLKSIVATITVPAEANGLALDDDGETLYVSTGYFGIAATPSIVIIDTLLNKIDNVVSLGNLVPLHIAMHPNDTHLYIAGVHNDSTSNLAYSVLDTSTAKVSEVAVTLPPGIAPFRQFNNFVFNQDGSRLYLAPQTLSSTSIPVLEVNTANGAVTRVLPVPSGYADQHDFVKMAASFADGKFILAFFIAEHLHHYPAEPPRRVVLIDGTSGTVIKELVYPSPYNNSAIVGDILDTPSTPIAGKVATITTLRASTNPPLRPNIPLVLDAAVAGNTPTGHMVFQFAAVPPRSTAHPRQPSTVKVRHVLQNGTASLSLRPCDTRWTNQALHHVVCASHFEITARYQGDKHNRKSVSATLDETR